MDEVCRDAGPVEVNATPGGTKRALQRLGTGHLGRACAESPHLQASEILVLFPEAADLHFHKLGQLPTQVVHMHSRAPIDMWRILIGEEKSFHAWW
jgi:hypothetical protein